MKFSQQHYSACPRYGKNLRRNELPSRVVHSAPSAFRYQNTTPQYSNCPTIKTNISQEANSSSVLSIPFSSPSVFPLTADTNSIVPVSVKQSVSQKTVGSTPFNTPEKSVGINTPCNNVRFVHGNIGFDSDIENI